MSGQTRTSRRRGSTPARAFGIAAFAAAGLLLPCTLAQAQTPSPEDYRLIVRVPRQEVDQWLKEQVAKSGGDLDNERYHFVLGFSTGHYGSDPVHAIAMRRLAFSLLNNTFAAGDRVTAAAWELKLWEKSDPIPLTNDPKSRAQFVDQVPYAPVEGSRGGHDTERALFDTLTQAVPKGQEASTVILLLTNTNQSQGPTGERVQLFGANNKQLAEAIRSKGYRPPVRHSFTANTRDDSLTIDVTALFPKELTSLAGVPKEPRFPTFSIASWQPAADRPVSGEALPNPAPTADPGGGTGEGASGSGAGTRDGAAQPAAPGEKSSPLGWILGALAALGLIGLIAWLMTRNKGQTPAQKAVAAPKGKPLPGAVKATVGTAPNSSTVVLKPLTTASAWTLIRGTDGKAVLSDDEEAKGERLARVALDERRRMLLQAEADVVFQNVTGVKADAGNPRQLVMNPGDHLVCRVASATTSGQPTRLELLYQDKA